MVPGTSQPANHSYIQCHSPIVLNTCCVHSNGSNRVAWSLAPTIVDLGQHAVHLPICHWTNWPVSMQFFTVVASFLFLPFRCWQTGERQARGTAAPHSPSCSFRCVSFPSRVTHKNRQSCIVELFIIRPCLAPHPARSLSFEVILLCVPPVTAVGALHPDLSSPNPCPTCESPPNYDARRIWRWWCC